MQKLNINLENCYGIKKFKTELDFSSHRSVAIYASNGMMKTSFAKTFEDLSEGEDSKDEVFSDRVTIREIKDERGNEVNKENIFVIKRYIPDFTSKKIATLLVNENLKKDYAKIKDNIDKVKEDLFKKLKSSSGLRQNIEEEIIKRFSNKQFFDILETNVTNFATLDPKFKDIKYNKIFNDKVLNFLNTPDVKTQIKEYIEKYDELLNNSRYLKRGFNHHNITSIQKELKEHNFFKAHHFITLHNEQDEKEIKNEEDFATVIQEEKNTILSNPDLLKKWDAINKKLDATAELRSFGDYLLDNKEIVSELEHPETFAQEIWMSYFIDQKELCVELLLVYQTGKKELEKIVKSAKEQETTWKVVVEKFNERFVLPLTITIENQDDVILNSSNPHTKFTFRDSNGRVEMEKNRLQDVLSDGEQRALYHLDIFFEVETREKANQETLFIIDDIADSFDYKNKYAIIQYLKEMSEKSLFNLIILTHNFDFFRTIESRGIVHRKNCFSAYKSVDDEVKLEPTEGLRNMFTSMKENLDEPKKLIASIAFVRNIIEYTKGKDDEGFKKLTSLLHWKPDTEKILKSDLKKIFEDSSITLDKFPTTNPSEKIIDMIFKESKECLRSVDGVNFENKIVLSIGIRLTAEHYMIEKIIEKDSTYVFDYDKRHQTSRLIEKYKEINPSETEVIKILEEVNLMTPSNIHLNSFMYEPILDMSDNHLKNLYTKLDKFNE